MCGENRMAEGRKKSRSVSKNAKLPMTEPFATIFQHKLSCCCATCDWLSKKIAAHFFIAFLLTNSCQIRCDLVPPLSPAGGRWGCASMNSNAFQWFLAASKKKGIFLHALQQKVIKCSQTLCEIVLKNVDFLVQGVGKCRFFSHDPRAFQQKLQTLF